MRHVEVLIIIHDKMDHAKTACLLFTQIKATDGKFKLHIAVTSF